MTWDGFSVASAVTSVGSTVCPLVASVVGWLWGVDVGSTWLLLPPVDAAGLAAGSEFLRQKLDGGLQIAELCLRRRGQRDLVGGGLPWARCPLLFGKDGEAKAGRGTADCKRVGVGVVQREGGPGVAQCILNTRDVDAGPQIGEAGSHCHVTLHACPRVISRRRILSRRKRQSGAHSASCAVGLHPRSEMVAAIQLGTVGDTQAATPPARRHG